MARQVEPGFQIKMKLTDQSLRLLTTTIKGMKQWAVYKDRLPLLFEVFGVYLLLYLPVQVSPVHSPRSILQ